MSKEEQEEFEAALDWMHANFNDPLSESYRCSLELVGALHNKVVAARLKKLVGNGIFSSLLDEAHDLVGVLQAKIVRAKL